MNVMLWEMIIIGLLSTREEAIEVQHIAKIVMTSNRFKEIAGGIHDKK